MSQFEDLQGLDFLLKRFLGEFSSAALLNSEVQVLGMNYESIQELGTFGPLVQTIAKYFSPAPGDVILTNDPYLGGTNLSTFALVTCIQIGDQRFYLVARTRFPGRYHEARRLDDEGLRVPPTPIFQKGQLAEDILRGIQSHPKAPGNFQEKIADLISRIHRQVDILLACAQKHPGLLSRPNQKALIQDTKRNLLRKIEDIPRGESNQEIQFESGEIIRLHTEISAQGIHFDFAGTSGSDRMFIPDMVTFGACLGSFLSFLRGDMPINEGVFSLVNVTTPTGCFLSAKYPAPFFEGSTEASTILANAIFHSLSEITSSQGAGVNSGILTVISLEFSPHQSYFDLLSGGMSASAHRPGLDSHHPWSFGETHESVEKIESHYPLIVRNAGLRPNSSGKGRLAGGLGSIREIELCQDATLHWLMGPRHTQVKNLKNAPAGQPPEIVVTKREGEKIQLKEVRGKLSVKKGDRILIASAGGAGFGKNLPT